MKSLGRVWIPAGKLYNLYEESGYQQDSCEISRKSLDTSRIAVKALGKSGHQQDTCEVSRKSLDTSRIALHYLGRVVKSLGRVWTPEG